jgi:hypothetical protein
MGGKSWWWSLWRSLVLAAATFVAGVLVSLLYLWWRDALSAVHFAYCLYALGGLVAAGYVLVLLGKNSAVGLPGLTPPPYAYYPLDRELVGGRRRRMGEMEELTALVLATVVLFWGVGAVAELYL